ncbi:kinase-like domain-containing protein [Lipomyces chichibuensis]|uniref:kinase-like domain-containing protein n=1 Tax=Lipomyces chichibuensis TaxID=1546026 RepID=UPI00334354E5
MPPRQPNPQPRSIGAPGGRVLGEITNVQAYSSEPPRPSSGQSKVSSAIQHFSRITAAATSSSNRPVTSRPTDIDTNGHEGNSGRKHQQSEECLQRENAYNLQSSPESTGAKFVSSSSPVHTDDDPVHTDDDYYDERITDKRVSQASTGTNSSSTSSGGRRKTHVGPWRLGRTLGRGSSGRVRLAKHAETGRLAAVKIVPKSANFDESDDKSGKKGKDAAGLPYGIEREVIIMKLIEHPNVMGLYDVWENRGELYLILEYVEGGELFDYLIKRGRLEEKEAVHYFRQIILGMDYCHKFNICHRDLKPENLLIDKYHNIKIADFGMAALEASGKMLETSCGSPHYASPEIVAGKTYHGAPSDIWSCGVILFALLTGHLPFDDDNIRNLLMKVQAGRFQMPSDLSIHAKDLIWRILKTNPDERITAAEILEHALLKKYPSQELPVEVFGHTLRVDRPVRSIEEIDLEIVKNLQTLWHGEDKNVIIQRLLSVDRHTDIELDQILKRLFIAC